GRHGALDRHLGGARRPRPGPVGAAREARHLPVHRRAARRHLHPRAARRPGRGRRGDPPRGRGPRRLTRPHPHPPKRPAAPPPTSEEHLMARGTTTTGAGLAALALLGASACSAASGDDGGTVLRIGELGAVPAAPALLEAAGVDHDLPYEIEWKQFANAGPEYVEAAGVDEVDLGVTADNPQIFAYAADAGLKAAAVGSIDASDEQSDNSTLVPAGSDASSVADLKGARVAFQEGTITQYHVIKALESEGLGLDDIEPVNLPVTDGATALQNGEVDALATLQTHWAQAEADGARALVTGSGLIAGNSLVSARAEAIDDPDLGPAIEDYLGRLAEAVQWKEEHPREWAEIYAG